MMTGLTIAQVAERLGIKETAARSLLRGEGALPHWRVGRGPKAGIRVRSEDLDAWLERRVATDTARDTGTAARAVVPMRRPPGARQLPDIGARIAARGRS